MKKFIISVLILYVFIFQFVDYSFSNDKSIDPYILNSNNQGTEFYLSFVPAWYYVDTNSYIKIMVTSNVRTKVKFSIESLGRYEEKIVEPLEIIAFDLTHEEAHFYIKGMNDPPQPEKVWSKRAIKIESEAPIVVYGISRYEFTSDGFLALPVNNLGMEYQVSSYNAPQDKFAALNAFYPSSTAIVGVYDNTVIKFILGGNKTTKIPLENGGYIFFGDSITKTINKGDIWLIPSEGGYCDLTGSTIKASKPVSVFSGSYCPYIPIKFGSCDFIIEQENPIESWGRNYFVMPIKDRKKSNSQNFC